ncbi:MAG TPA: hypothetical protein EYQ69_08755 [Gemmatimonadetes bacterium]|nr:hypothetical protein [Gemmatimonadota bacterium]
MTKTKSIILSILAVVFLNTAPTVAQVIPSPYEFIENRQTGRLLFGQADIQSGQLDIGPRTASIIGGRYGISVGSVLTIEVNVSRYKSTRSVYNVTATEGRTKLGDTELNFGVFDLRFRLNLTGHRTWHNIQPYLAFGGGAAASLAADQTLEQAAGIDQDNRYDFGSQFATVIAGGTDFQVSERISLFTEGVFNLWKVGTPAGWLTTDLDPQGTNPKDEWVATKNIFVGVSYRF